MYHTLTRLWAPPTPLWSLCVKGGYLCLAEMGKTLLVCLANFSAYLAKLHSQGMPKARYEGSGARQCTVLPMSIKFEKVVKIDP